MKTSQLLLINTSVEDRQLLRQVLEPMSLNITEVASGLEAVEELQRTDFDLVVTAIDIGEFDSWRLARFIRSGICRGAKNLPIIIVAPAWCERIMEITARDFGINQLLNFEERQRLPELVRHCLQEDTSVLGKRRVLVVEDHYDNAQLIRKILSPRFDVELVSDGAAGLASWKQHRHDLVVLDVMLPQMSGEEVLQQIVAIDPSQPVVMVTAHGTMEVAKRLLLRGAADFVTKPFRVDELRRVCELAIRREDYLVSNAQVVERMDRLQRLRSLLGNIVDSMPSLLIGVDLQGRVNLWNQQAEQVCAVAAADAGGRPLMEVWPEFSQFDEVQAALNLDEVRKLEKVTQRLQGVDCFCDVTIYPLREDCVVGAVIRIDDITERVTLEERIVQAEKMVTIGQLAAGMAHEINNPLAGVMQNVQVIKHRFSPDLKANRDVAETLGLNIEALAEYVERRDINARLAAVMEEGRRTVQLVDNMVNFSQRDNSSIIARELSELIDKSVELAAGKFSLKRKFDFRSIVIQRDYDPLLPLVECNPVQIQQVIFNLLLNGANAMERKAQRLRDENSDYEYQPRFVLRTRYVERKARIEIEDNGIGMDEKMRLRLFEPFYAAQNVDYGSGLGLSICYYIIFENHHGRLSVESRPNIGSKFILEIPEKQPV